MIQSEKQSSSESRREKIAERYKGVDPSLLEVIPAEMNENVNIMERKLKVAAYIRVSTDNDEQKSSYELQLNEFTTRIHSNPLWEFAGIYSDEGISGTELSHRKGMLQMIEDAKAGKIELILAKSIARFARNVVDCLSVIEELRNLKPPVGVFFDESNLYTLDTTGALVLTILATVAEEESRSKSFIMNWSVDRRFSKGIFLIPELLGYDKDEDGNLIINPEEAETVQVIYDLFVNGWTYTRLANLLTKYKRKTKLGNTKWSPGSIGDVISNERHVGDILARKTYTPNFKDHKSKINRKNRTQYRRRDNHEAIVSRPVFDAAVKLQASMKFSKGNRTMPVLSVVEGGFLKGYVPIHKDWTGFSSGEYKAVSEQFDQNVLAEVRPLGKVLNMTGYERIDGAFYKTKDKPALTVSGGRFRFNSTCLALFNNVEYVELLINTVKKCIAIRPCEPDNPNAIRWARLKHDKWAVRQLSCRGLSQVLADIMNWIKDDKYQLTGHFEENEDGKVLLFSLNNPVVIRTEDTVIMAEQNADEEHGKISVDMLPPKNCGDMHQDDKDGIVVSKTVRLYPVGEGCRFGIPVTSLVSVSLLEQHHYSGDWDVMRPAKEVEGLNILTAEDLIRLRKEAETIIERWAA